MFLEPLLVITLSGALDLCSNPMKVWCHKVTVFEGPQTIAVAKALLTPTGSAPSRMPGFSGSSLSDGQWECPDRGEPRNLEELGQAAALEKSAVSARSAVLSKPAVVGLQGGRAPCALSLLRRSLWLVQQLGTRPQEFREGQDSVPESGISQTPGEDRGAGSRGPQPRGPGGGLPWAVLWCQRHHGVGVLFTALGQSTGAAGSCCTQAGRELSQAGEQGGRTLRWQGLERKDKGEQPGVHVRAVCGWGRLTVPPPGTYAHALALGTLSLICPREVTQSSRRTPGGRRGCARSPKLGLGLGALTGPTPHPSFLQAHCLAFLV